VTTTLPVGSSPADVAERLCAAAPLVFDAERVQGYVARGRIAEAPGGAAVSLVQPLAGTSGARFVYLYHKPSLILLVSLE
jgi:hypothetical protein